MLQFQHRGRVQLNPFLLWIVTHRDIVPECPELGTFDVERRLATFDDLQEWVAWRDPDRAPCRALEAALKASLRV